MLGLANLLRILAPGQFVNVMTGSVGYLLSMSGQERDLRNVVFISGPMASILALVLTPLYGVTGAAVATAIALASQNLLAVGMVKRRLGFNTLAIWRKPKATHAGSQKLRTYRITFQPLAKGFKLFMPCLNLSL